MIGHSHPPPGPGATARRRIVVFSDDWGRHRSSAQFLAEQWLGQYDIEWIETIGTRSPSLSVADAKRAFEKLVRWMVPSRLRGSEQVLPPKGLRVHAPIMWPSFSSARARRANARILARTLRTLLAEGPAPCAILSTVPLVADVAPMFPAEHWVYYCVDALHQWDGLDRATLETMERQWVPHCDRVIAVSEELARRLETLGPRRPPQVVTHGVDFEQWHLASGPSPASKASASGALFFGAIDERLDVAACARVAESVGLLAIGPDERAPRDLSACPGLQIIGPRPHADLPALASAALVLVLPYRTDGSTQSLSPLKLKEYLATDRPVVVSDLPAVRAWSEALDIAKDVDDFDKLVSTRAATGTPVSQLRARAVLRSEGWPGKAAAMELCFRTPGERPPVVILHVRSCGGPGSGPEKTLLRSHRHADPARYRVLVALLCDPEDREIDALFAEAEDLGATLFRIDDRGPFDRTVLRSLMELVRREGVAVWHGHDAKSNVLGLRARRRAGMKLVATAHGWVHRTRRTPLYDRLDRWALRRHDGVIAVSQDTMDAVRLPRALAAFGRVIPNGIEPPPGALPWQSRRTDEVVLGAVGRLAPEKGLDDLLHALALLRADGQAVRLRIFGTGPMDGQLRELAAELGLLAHVDFRGFERCRATIYGSLDAFVLPSLREGTPNCLLEAMAFGRPIVATPVGGVEELVRDGVEALLVPPKNPDALADAIDRLLREPALAARLARAARVAAHERHGFSQRMRRVFELYDDVLKRDVLPGDPPERSSPRANIP